MSQCFLRHGVELVSLLNFDAFNSRASASLGLLLTSMYTGQDGDRMSQLVTQDEATMSTSIDSVSVTAMEHVEKLFQRVSDGGYVRNQNSITRVGAGLCN